MPTLRSYPFPPSHQNVKRIYSFEVEIRSNTAGLSKKSKVMVNQTRAVDKIRLIRSMGILPEEKIEKIDAALILHYDLD